MSSLRVFILGGLTSYRALFGWLSPWILIPTFILGPLFQILLFASIGRVAGVADDAFFLIGNAVLYAAIPCLFAMGNTIGGERYASTLPLLLASPARRIPLFLGRALPVILNGFA
ncbi:MAG TPA: ABC transporter permease, partial [Micromonosporaceae bacterium]